MKLILMLAIKKVRKIDVLLQGLQVIKTLKGKAGGAGVVTIHLLTEYPSVARRCSIMITHSGNQAHIGSNRI